MSGASRRQTNHWCVHPQYLTQTTVKERIRYPPSTRDVSSFSLDLMQSVPESKEETPMATRRAHARLLIQGKHCRAVFEYSEVNVASTRDIPSRQRCVACRKTQRACKTAGTTMFRFHPRTVVYSSPQFPEEQVRDALRKHRMFHQIFCAPCSRHLPRDAFWGRDSGVLIIPR